MGCGTFSVRYRRTELRPDQIEQIEKIDSIPKSNPNPEDEIEIQVVCTGKPIPKTILDEITENNISVTKIKDSSFNISTLDSSPNKPPLTTLNQSSVLLIHKDPSIPPTKIEFENLPPNFDFSYLDPVEAPNDLDLITDQLLQELSSINNSN